MFSEKATEFEKIFVVFLTRASCSVRTCQKVDEDFFKTRLKRFESKIAHKYFSNFKSINAPKNVNSANSKKNCKFCYRP